MRALDRQCLRAVVLTAVVGLPGIATADSIAITQGHVDADIFIGMAHVVFQGQDFQLDVSVEEGFRAPLALDCTPCAPGTTVNLSGAFVLPRAIGTAVVDGVSYPQIFVDGMTGTFESPSFAIDGDHSITVTRPFTYSGVVRGFVVDPFSASSDPVFTKPLVGRGTATALFSFSNAEGPLFGAHDIRYDFTDAGTVPEPASVLLCGVGSAMLVRRRRSGSDPKRPIQRSSRFARVFAYVAVTTVDARIRG